MNLKKAGYAVFAFFFCLGRRAPVNRSKVVLYSGHDRDLSGNLLEMKRALEKRAEAAGETLKFVVRTKQGMLRGNGLLAKIKGALDFFVVLPIHMATARQIFLNDNFLPLGYCKPSAQTQVIQMWHGLGAFKRFGLSTEEDLEVRQQVLNANRKITHLFVTSKQVIPYYAEAFGIGTDRIYATGLPMMDLYLDRARQQERRERFYQAYPSLRGKRLLLYTPTFRQSAQENAQIMARFPIQKIERLLGEDWVILVKMHPKYPVPASWEDASCLDVTEYSRIADLYFASDLLVTDYSSTVVEYVLLDKPVVLYAYDYESYDRGFYRPYADTAPGVVAYEEDDLLKALKDLPQGAEARKSFAAMQYDCLDGRATERILSVLEQTGR